ncbi:hypothetical protein V6N12_050851 [Hibiscus sabdariffa]|uniref:Uncharacterized protein n=1 Tax=Hibiscus sabdariffa TaxID=183260 RepID=A0ABR2GET1_9ROSI
MQQPRIVYWEVSLRVMRHLKGTPGQGILLRSNSELTLTRWCDFDRDACPLTRRSLTGWLVFLSHSPIPGKTKKQHTISRSSIETEYRSMAYKSGTKHIKVNYRLVRDAITEGLITSSCIPSTVQLADIFVKALGKKHFDFLLSKLGIVNPDALT